jgi:hypothetical protein
VNRDALTIGPTDPAQDLGVLGAPAQRQVLDQYRIINDASDAAVLRAGYAAVVTDLRKSA